MEINFDSEPRILTKEEKEIAAKEISENWRARRQGEYPNIGDQLDALMKWAAMTEMTIPSELKSIAISCMDIKEKYPKR